MKKLELLLIGMSYCSK